MPDPQDPDTLRRAFHRMAATPPPPPRHTDTDLVAYSRRMLTHRRVQLGLLAAAVLATMAWYLTRPHFRHRNSTHPNTHDVGSPDG